MAQKRILHLRVYRGSELNYDRNRNIKNETSLIKVYEDSVEYNNMVKLLRASGFCQIELEALKTQDGKDVEDPEFFEQVNEAFKDKKAEVELTPDQKRIAQLEQMVKELAEGKKEKSKTKKTVVVDSEKTPEDPNATHVPELPEGKKLSQVGIKALTELFPNIADLNPEGVKDFRKKVKETYPGKYD